MGVITCPKETFKNEVEIWLVKEAWCPYCKWFESNKCTYKTPKNKDKKRKRE
jgi:hypothetical protein